MTLSQKLRDYRTQATSRPSEPLRGVRRITADDAVANHFIGCDSRQQYFQVWMKTSGQVFWTVVR